MGTMQGGVDSQRGRQYDVARDGRFLIHTVGGRGRRADHAHPEREPRGEEVTLARLIGPPGCLDEVAGVGYPSTFTPRQNAT
jgi:hypothetical protein